MTVMNVSAVVLLERVVPARVTSLSHDTAQHWLADRAVAPLGATARLPMRHLCTAHRSSRRTVPVCFGNVRRVSRVWLVQ